MKRAMPAALLPLLLLIACEREYAPTHTLVAITFDDCHESIYTHAMPLMEPYGFCATNFVNSGFIGLPHKLTWDMTEALEFNHGWETGGHTVHHINMPDCDSLTVDTEVRIDQLALIGHGLSHTSFALPCGHAGGRDMDIVLSYYRNVRTSKADFLYRPLDRTRIGYKGYRIQYSADDMIDWLSDGILAGADLLVVGVHTVMTDEEMAEEGNGVYKMNCAPQDFARLMAWIARQELQTVTISQAAERLTD